MTGNNKNTGRDYMSLLEDRKVPLWFKIISFPLIIILTSIEDFKFFILDTKEVITLFGVFVALSVYLTSISEIAAAYSLILLFSVSLVLLVECMTKYKGRIIQFPLLLIIGGLTEGIYSYSMSKYSVNIDTFLLQVVKFYGWMTAFAVGLLLVLTILTYFAKNILKKNVDLVEWFSQNYHKD